MKIPFTKITVAFHLYKNDIASQPSSPLPPASQPLIGRSQAHARVTAYGFGVGVTFKGPRHALPKVLLHKALRIGG